MIGKLSALDPNSPVVHTHFEEEGLISIDVIKIVMVEYSDLSGLQVGPQAVELSE